MWGIGSGVWGWGLRDQVCCFPTHSENAGMDGARGVVAGSDLDAGGFVDLGYVLHVFEAFFAGGLGLEVVLDAVGEVFRLRDKVRGVAGGV